MTFDTDVRSGPGLAEFRHLRGLFGWMKEECPGPLGITWESTGVDNPETYDVDGAARSGAEDSRARDCPSPAARLQAEGALAVTRRNSRLKLLLVLKPEASIASVTLALPPERGMRRESGRR